MIAAYMCLYFLHNAITTTVIAIIITLANAKRIHAVRLCAVVPVVLRPTDYGYMKLQDSRNSGTLITQDILFDLDLGLVPMQQKYSGASLSGPWKSPY